MAKPQSQEGRIFYQLRVFASLRLCVPVFFALFVVAGCVSKSKARINAQQAYIAGQQSAMMTMQQNKTSVQVRGNVKNTVIPWTEGLTMAQAIVAAEYQGAHDPSSVIIVRNGTGTEIKAVELLHGHDEPLQPGDMIEIR